MRPTISVIVLCMGLVQGATAQEDSLFRPRWELAGSLHFSINDQPEFSLSGEIEHRTYSWAFQPEVGLFLNEQMEIGMTVRFQQTREEGEKLRTLYSAGSSDYTVATDLTLAMGVGWNVMVSRWMCPFLFLKTGLNWNYRGYRSGCIVGEVWSTPRVVFPIFQGGVKCFVSQRVALVLQSEYEHISSENQSKLVYGVGFAVYI